MYKLFSSFLFISLLGLVSCAPKVQEYGERFSNPVIAGDMADPTIIRVGNAYYATGTSSEWAPFYPLFTSRDLMNWTQIGHIFEKQPEWTVSSFWAPELFYHNETVYCYYTARRKTDGVSYIGVATATDPAGPYTDHGLLVEYGTEAIDAFVYDDDGQLYISWKAYGLDDRPIELLGCKLSDDGLHLEGEPFTLLKDDKRIGMEGQYHFKKDDYYYIIYSAHGCCGPKSDYDVYVARSKSYKGPYEKYKKNPILHGGGDFISCGHGTATTTYDGRMFYLCHAYQSGEAFYMGRQPILQEMIVGDDGWVHFPSGTTAAIKQPIPLARTVQQAKQPFEDKFSSPKLRNEWTWNYVYSDIDVRIENGLLQLSGQPKDGNNYGTALCLRPTFPRYAFETRIIHTEGSSGGLTMYGDDHNLLLWILTDNKLVLKTVIGGKETVWHEVPVEGEAVWLRIDVARDCQYMYSWKSTDEGLYGFPQRIVNACDALMRWDRVARPGLIHVDGRPSAFSIFKMTNL